MKRWTYLIRGMPLTLLGLLLFVPAIHAAALSQGYVSTEDLPVGSLVSSDPASAVSVRAANGDNLSELLGVTVTSDGSLLAISGGGSNVQVTTTGVATALVSTYGGDIKKGDSITASPINGVGAKSNSPGRILGFAQADFNEASTNAVKREVDTGSGKKSVTVGSIPVIIQIGFYNPQDASDDNVIPESVQNLAAFLAGKEVSTVRILIATLLLLLGIILAFIILNSAVRSSMTSIGRNPLAKSAVNRGLIKVLLLALVILLVTFGSVYFVIKG